MGKKIRDILVVVLDNLGPLFLAGLILAIPIFAYFHIQQNKKIELCKEKASSYVNGKKSMTENNDFRQELDHELDKKFEKCEEI